MTINPALRPIREAEYGVPLLIYSEDPSPLWQSAINASIAYGFIGNGRMPGVHVQGYGFWPHFKDTKLGVTWTHFSPAPDWNPPDDPAPDTVMAFLRDLDAHLRVTTGAKGKAHAEEGLALRARLRALLDQPL